MSNYVYQIWEELEKSSPNNFARRLYKAPCKYKQYCVYDSLRKYFGIAISYSQSLKIDISKLTAFKYIQMDVKKDNAFANTDRLQVTFLNSTDVSQKEILAELSQNILEYVETQKDENLAVHAFINQLLRWEDIFSKANRKGLSPSEQKGLYGELYLMRKLLTATVASPIEIMNTWTGPNAGVQDFQCDSWAIEVKTSSSANPQSLKINNERQLDEDLQQNLFLYHLSVQEGKGNGDSLNAIIKDIRDFLASDIPALMIFNVKLNDVGYFDSENYLYEDKRYQLREDKFYKIEGDFPRIKENELRPGVGATIYSIAVSSCDKYVFSEKNVLKTIKQ